MFSVVRRDASGTRSTISRPKPSRPPYFAGLFVISRIVVIAEVDEDLRADAVLARVGREAELLVGLDGVAALVLQRVRAQLVAEADAAALVAAQVDDHALALRRDLLERAVELQRRSRSASSRTRRR